MRALVIGAGGLGAPALLGLADRGARHVTIYDPDRVELSNLHRQILFAEADLGQKKADVAKARLEERFAALEVEAHAVAFDATMQGTLQSFDVVLDGTDRFEVKLEIHDLCLDAGVPYVFAGVVATQGQVLGVLPGRSACLRCLFDEAPPPGSAPTCEELGIFGPIAGITAARQVEVAFALAHPMGRAIAGELWSYDGVQDRARTLSLAPMQDCRGCGDRRHLRGRLGEVPFAGSLEADEELDLTGRACPVTFIETRRRLEALPRGGRLWVVLSSDESARNVPRSCIAAGHKVLAQRALGRHHRILLERADEGDS